MPRALSEPNLRQTLQGKLPHILHLAPARSTNQRQLNVLERSSAAEQIESLKHETEFQIAKIGEFIAIERAHIISIEEIFAASGRIETAENIHERGLS